MRRAATAVAVLGAAIASLDEIFAVECDVFAPCALGSALNPDTVPRLRCRIVAGAANNQLADVTMGPALMQRGILYAPDYAINAGGLINVAQEYKGYDEAESRAKCSRIYDTIAEIAQRSAKTGKSPAVIADKLVDDILERAGSPLSAGPADEAKGAGRTRPETVN